MNLLEGQGGQIVRFQNVNSIEMITSITFDPAGTWIFKKKKKKPTEKKTPPQTIEFLYYADIQAKNGCTRLK